MDKESLFFTLSLQTCVWSFLLKREPAARQGGWPWSWWREAPSGAPASFLHILNLASLLALFVNVL